MRATFAICLMAFAHAFACLGDGVLTTAADVGEATLIRPRASGGFDVTGTVTYTVARSGHDYFGLRDETDSTRFFLSAGDLPKRLQPGDSVRVCGLIVPRAQQLYAHAVCTGLCVRSHGPAPAPADMKLADVAAHDPRPAPYDFTYIRVCGTVGDIFPDEIDSRYVFLVLNDGHSSICAASKRLKLSDLPAERFIGRRVAVSGICIFNNNKTARQIPRFVNIGSLADIEFLNPSDADPFDARKLAPDGAESVRTFIPLERRYACGRVIAVWQRDNLLLAADDGQTIRVKLVRAEPPAVNDRIETVGFADFDLFQQTLTQAIWRPLPNAPATEEHPLAVSGRQLATNGYNSKINPQFNGQAVRLTGTITTLPTAENGDGRFFVESAGVLIPVDASTAPEALDGVSVGCTVEITGVCVTETEATHTPWTIPHARGNTVVLRRHGDIRVLSSPPWWTPARLTAVIVALLAVVIVFIVLSESFRRLAERRGRALARESVQIAEATLRTYERTRLAVELHDSIAQNLTGVSMEIRTANRLGAGAPPELLHHLDIALKTVNSTRNELRNCIWDLRNSALEENALDCAIRQTLAPHLGDTALFVRFNVPRERFSDNTAHAILSIIRELAINAIRHGCARTIRVAGAIENGSLLFSVKDDGCGFNPASSPGAEQGHFGLQGIRERARSLRGTVTVESRPGIGTKVTIAIELPRPAKEEET